MNDPSSFHENDDEASGDDLDFLNTLPTSSGHDEDDDDFETMEEELISNDKMKRNERMLHDKSDERRIVVDEGDNEGYVIIGQIHIMMMLD
jgi:hypothetical protein